MFFQVNDFKATFFFLMYFFLIFNLCERTKLKDKHTKELFSQHGELLFVEASPGKSGELPAEDLRELAPAGPRRVPKESQVLWRKMEKVREAVKHKKWKQTSPKQLENMSYSYRRTRVNGTSAEFVVTLWKSKSWNLSQFSSCFIYELMLNSGDGGELQDLFVIYVILMLLIAHLFWENQF